MDREAWQAAVLGVTKSGTQHTHTHTRCHILHTEYNYVIYSASYLSVIVYYPMFHSDN